MDVAAGVFSLSFSAGAAAWSCGFLGFAHMSLSLCPATTTFDVRVEAASSAPSRLVYEMNAQLWRGRIFTYLILPYG